MNDIDDDLPLTRWGRWNRWWDAWWERHPRLATWHELSSARMEIDLLRWRLRFSAGYDRENDCCELLWLYTSLGPLHLSLAFGHWD